MNTATVIGGILIALLLFAVVYLLFWMAFRWEP